MGPLYYDKCPYGSFALVVSGELYAAEFLSTLKNLQILSVQCHGLRYIYVCVCVPVNMIVKVKGQHQAIFIYNSTCPQLPQIKFPPS